MKRLLLAIATSAISLSLSLSTAHADPGKFYLQIDGGAAIPGDNEVDGLDIEYDVGFVVGGRIGYWATEQSRIEFDVSYASAEIDEIDGVNLNNIGVDADVSVLSFDVGGYLDFLQSGAISPYFGAGVGVAYKELDTNIEDDDETDVTVFGEAGMGFTLTPNIEVVPHYRLQWLPDTFDDEQLVHLLRLGLRFNP